MTYLASGLILLGSFFALVAAIGVIRFPDVFTRMHASSKAASFGIALTLLGTALEFNTPGAYLKALLTIFFVFLTLPVSTHLLARVARKRIEAGIDQQN